jgi:hypothetical protein
MTNEQIVEYANKLVKDEGFKNRKALERMTLLYTKS